MKTKFLYVIIPLLVLICSCDLSFGDIDPSTEGLSFRVVNNTNTIFKNTRFYLGGIKEGIFIVSDSSDVMSEIPLNGRSFFVDGWLPNLDSISANRLDTVFFKIRLSPEPNEFIKFSNLTDKVGNFNFLIKDRNKLRNEFGLIRVYISDERVSANFDYEF